MGEVWKARDEKLDRDVAIKVLPEALFGDADLVARFEREAKALAALNHPGIAAIHSFEEVGGRHLLVQELLEGETLRQVLASGKLPIRKTLDYAVQIARALAAAHEKGVVHRDLKPENLFVTSDGRIKILDFGLAKLTKPEESAQTNLPTVSRGTEPGVVLGTLGYMSPEQVRGKPADARSDIFSFGAVLYEMLSGKRAFAGDSAADTMSAILKEDPPELAVTNQSMPPGLERIVRHCLEKKPEQRFHSAHDLAFDLEALSTLSAPGLAPPPALRARRLPSPALVMVALAALGLGVLGDRLLLRGRPVEPPLYQRLTFRRGAVNYARFAPDGHTIVYSAAWDGASRPQLYSTRMESPDSSRLTLPDRDVRSISKKGELLLLEVKRYVSGHTFSGTLSQAPISGNAARDLLEDVAAADWSPDGSSYAVVRAPEWHYRLEFPPGKVLYQTTGWISHPRVSPKGDAVAFFDHPFIGDDRGTVAVVDLKGTKKTLSPEWESEQGLAWSPGGDEVWYTATGAGNARSLYAVTLSGRQRRVGATPSGMTLQDISGDGRVLFIEENARQEIVGLAPGDARERNLSAFEWPFGPRLTPDGKTLLFSEAGQSAGSRYAVYLRRLDGSAAIQLGEGAAMALSPDGKWVLALLVGSTPTQLQLLPTGAGEPRRLPSNAVAQEDAAFFPDGKRILYVGREPGRPERSFVQDLEGGPARPATPEGVRARLLSPDGKSVVIASADGRLALLPLEAGPAQPIAGAEPWDVPLAWAEDGRSLFVSPSSAELVAARLFRIDAASGRRELWKEFTPGDSAGARYSRRAGISADGKTMVFLYRTSSSILYVAEGLR